MPQMLALLGNSSSFIRQFNSSHVTADDYRSMMEVVRKSTKMNNSALGLEECSIEAELNQVQATQHEELWSPSPPDDIIM